MTIVFSFITGAVLGAIFTLVRLPIPAPPTLAGIAGIVGVYVGYLIMTRII